MSASAPPTRRILHVDVDAMFVQCARIADPALANEELIVVGGSPEGRGVVASASYGCRRYGVRSAMPMAEALRLCPRAVRVGVSRAVVGQKHRELEAALGRWTPLAAMASVDEGYLDLTGCEALYDDEPLEATARRIQRAVREEVGLDVSIGGGSNKLIAKLATSLAKPAGVHVVPAGGEADFVATLHPGEIPGFGPVLVAELKRRGLDSIAALRALDMETLRRWWGEERARTIWARVRGISHEPVTVGDDIPQSVSSERTYARDLVGDDELARALLALVAEAAQAMRKKGLSARTVTVKARDPRFQDRQKSRTLPEPVRTERAILPIARELLLQLRADHPTPIRLLGVRLSSLTHLDAPEQTTLLDVAPAVESERDRRLAAAADALRARFGKRAIGPGGMVGGE
jgi:DNA polymerase-4